MVVLAAGAGRRFVGETHKLLAPLRGARVIDRAVDAAVDAAVGDVVVVTGAVAVPSLPDGVRVVHNPDWASGQRSSAMLALDLAEGDGVEAVVIGLADQPFVGADGWRAVARSSAPLAVASYDGRRAPPVRIHRSLWDEARRTHGDPDEGLRSFIGLRTVSVEEVPCGGSPDDIDSPEDLLRWT